MDHYYKDVPGWAAFTKLYENVVNISLDGARFVEVGSWLGRSAAFMGVEIINSGKDIAMMCVDPWTDGGPDLRDTKYFKEQREPIYDQFKRNTLPVAAVVDSMQMMSVDAATRFNDHCLDFIMLDGDHSYEAVKADIAAWLPKVKAGGIIAGDDYLWPGVKQAAGEAFGDRLECFIKTPTPADYRKTSAYWWVIVR